MSPDHGNGERPATLEKQSLNRDQCVVKTTADDFSLVFATSEWGTVQLHLDPVILALSSS